MNDAGAELADRVRALLGSDAEIEEKRMFGSRAFLLGGHIVVGARKDGTLLVRVTEEQGAAMLMQPGASRARMGARTMSNGWLDVDATATDDDASLMLWLDVARECATGT